MPHSYLIRFGLNRHVGRFPADSDRYERGQTVVIRSHRGLELGEVLLRAPAAIETVAPLPSPTQVLRIAGPDDLDRSQKAALDRPDRFASCERVFLDGVWPLELLDVEPLLDDRRTVLHYLGPHHLDASGLVAALRTLCDLDVVLEPVGIDAPAEPSEAEAEAGCGSGGGCSSGGCGSGSGSESGAHGCSGCAVKSLVAARQR